MEQQPAAPSVSAAPAKAGWPGVGGIYSNAWQGLKVNIQPAAVYALVVGIAAILDKQVGFDTQAEGAKATAYVVSGGPYSIIVTLVFLLGAVLLGLAIADKKQLPLARLASFDKRWLYMLGMYILATIGIALGLLLLIIPGIILALMWTVAPYDVADRRDGPIQSLKESSRLTKGYRWRIFLVMLVSLLLILPMALLLAIPYVGPVIAGLFIAYYYGIGATIYRALQAEKGSVPAPSAEATTTAAPA